MEAMGVGDGGDDSDASGKLPATAGGRRRLGASRNGVGQESGLDSPHRRHVGVNVTAFSTGASQRPGAGLDLSFGDTPMQFERINLLGSELSEHAISSLVLSVPNITYLDLRGNRLSAQFGWKLVKSMKKKYLNLDFCNGIHLRDLKSNRMDTLNLAGFSQHHGMYGIEVVGAIFLAHFLRLNNSLRHFNFKRNDVEKDGAKALAQSLLGNPHCALVTVNTMGPSKNGAKPGIDFQLFRAGNIRVVNLPKRLLDDDDFVFLEEWLRRYDCVEELDISGNLLSRDGVRKLARYVKDTATLRKLNAAGLPVDLDGTQLLSQATVQNQTLQRVALPLGPCDDNVERHQMLQQFGLGLYNHPCMIDFSCGRPNGLEYTNLASVKAGEVTEFPPVRSNNWPSAQLATYMWFLGAAKAPVESFTFGYPGKKLTYPLCTGTQVELWPIIPTLVHDLHKTLTTISICVGGNPKRGLDGLPRVMDLMRVLTRCTALKNLSLLAYGSSVLKETQLPQEWVSLGSAPRWLLEGKGRGIRVQWQALHGLLSTNTLSGLESFNDITMGGILREQPELTVLLLLQCLEGVAVSLNMEQQPGGEVGVMDANLQANANVEVFCEVLRLLSRSPLLIRFTFADGGRLRGVEAVKAQQARLSGPLSGIGASGVDGGLPPFVHSVVLMNKQTSEELLRSLDHRAPLREFGYENLTMILPALFACLCGRERPLPLERIRVDPKWITASLARKRFSIQQRKLLEGVQAALIRSETFQSVETAAEGEVSREQIETMSAQEFAALMTGYSVEEPQASEVHSPQIPWKCFSSHQAYARIKANTEADTEAEGQIFLTLPLNEETMPQDGLVRLSLCMCEMRRRIVQGARPDEWPAPSRAIWGGPQRRVRPGDWDEFEPKALGAARERFDIDGECGDGDDEAGVEDAYVRYQWRPGSDVRIGTRRAADMVENASASSTLPFGEILLHDILKSLLAPQASMLQILDVRGNGLTRSDANLLLALTEQHQTLVLLNEIPVVMDRAQTTTTLVLDSTKIDKRTRFADDGADDDDAEEGPVGEVLAAEAIEAEMVRMDDGDGFIFLSLLTPQWFPRLKRIELRRLEIPQDSTLAHMTDAMLGLPCLKELVLSELKLSGRGASLLLQAVAEMASNIDSLNGLPLSRLVARREAAAAGGGIDSGPLVQLPTDIEWNDFPLGAMARLGLWPAASAPVPPPPPAIEGSLGLRGAHLTDVGLRGLCTMLRHFGGMPQQPGTRTTSGPLQLTTIDLSGNPFLTDDAVGDLCHALQHPTMGASLRSSLRELSLRSCARLKARSALELQGFVLHVRDGSRTGEPGALQFINGVDMEALQAAGRSGAGRGSSAGSSTAVVLRTYVEAPGTSSGANPTPRFSSLSECDVIFFASMLHLFPFIPYCHVHVLVPLVGGPHPANKIATSGLSTWGRDLDLARPDVAGSNPLTTTPAVSNESPFPAPTCPSSRAFADIVQKHLNATQRLFEACPFSMQLRFSMAPVIPDCEGILASGDHHVLGITPSASQNLDRGSQNSSFAMVKLKLQAKAHKRRCQDAKRRGDSATSAVTAPRPLYVNNINSQRSHCSYRTLFGKDEMDVIHRDIMPDERNNAGLPTEVDISHMFAVSTSLDLQHLELGPLHLSNMHAVSDMPVLTHVNLNSNLLGNPGVDILFRALVEANSSVVHVALAHNSIGDEGAASIAVSLASLPRLTSLELCDNFILERGSIALAEAIGGVSLDTDGGGDHEEGSPHSTGPLPFLSIDLRGNRSRELGARRWAEVICNHPDMKFLCLAQNEIGYLTKDSFLDLVCAAVASVALSVLDLQDNFLPIHAQKLSVDSAGGPPPQEVVDELLVELPPGEFDPAEVRRAVFIRRHRGGASQAKARQQLTQGSSQVAASSATP